MCGITGLVFLKGVKRSPAIMRQLRFFMDELLIETQDRGEHATGVASFRRNGEYDFHKKKGNAVLMTTTDEEYRKVIDALSPTKSSVLISHTRYLTKGSAENNDNNHPFDIGCVVGIHNGSLRNDDELFKIYESDFKRIGTVDSEVIYQMFNHYGKEMKNFDYATVKRVLEEGHGDKNLRMKALAALAFVHKETPTMLHLVKGPVRPIDLAYWEEAGVIIFNSVDKYIKQAFATLERAGKALGFETNLTVKYMDVKEHHYLTIDSTASTVEEAISELMPIKIDAPATSSYGGSSGNWDGYGRNTSSGCSTSNSGCGTNKTNVSTKNTAGRVIEGALDEKTGEITIFTLEETAGATGDEEGKCAECDAVLSNEEKTAAYNNGAAPQYHVCSVCYEKMLQGKFLQASEEDKKNATDGVVV